ncbi:hypothetical protein GCM10007175_04280 [Pseudarthrobacter scleromae]|uniref:Uncharacterized protein n=2 Tax=Pseudarthrobacter scleromae TaxID=158897 RepID=A0ABQ2C9U2_9MICC|nr:hypothetical protein GCM10007175_04280 [Pseudarthrobacter scleromae]
MLPGHLRDTGLHYAHRALEQYSAWDDLQLLDAAVAIGSAVELLAKAILSDVDPVLLLDRQEDRKSLMLLSGEAAHPKGINPNPLTVKSISATKAVNRLTDLGLVKWDKTDDVVFDVRNAATHMGLVSPEMVQVAVVAMVGFCDKAREYFGKGEIAWWGVANIDIATKMLAGAEKRLALLVAGKFSTARQVLARHREEGLSADLQDAILSSKAEEEPSLLAELAGRLPCPVCAYSGWAIGFSRVDRALEPGSLEAMTGADMDVWAFQCHVCGLVLDGYEQILECGLPEVLHLDHQQST